MTEPTSASLAIMLRALKLATVRRHADEISQQAEREGWTFQRYLHHLVELEMLERRRRRIERNLKDSGLPADKTLATLVRSRLPAKIAKQVATLCEGAFVERGDNLLAFGLPGRGKTHLVCAVAHELIQRGYRVLFTATFALVQRLLIAKRDLRLEDELAILDGFDAVLLDDIGYVQQNRDEMEVLFTFLAERYERRTVIITSNLVFSEWDRIFKDPMTTAAAIDRLVHHSVILEMTGKSIRIEDAQADHTLQGGTTPTTTTAATRIAPLGLLPSTGRCLTESATRGGRPQDATMAKRISVDARRELVRAIGERYREAAREDKLQILDEFVAVTGYHRKHSIRVLNSVAAATVTARPPRLRLYDQAVREVLIVLWEAADRICGKRLKALVPVLLPALERHKHLQLDAGVREKVLAVSASTIDRMLATARGQVDGRRTRASAKPSIRRAVPVRTFGDWNDPLPGFMEADLVSHGGENVAGSFAHTLVLTDIASGWTECVALAVREGSLIVDALTRLRTTMPFPLRGFDTDNGSEFINETVLAYCAEAKIEFTRARPYRKNDQAWVEQKNGSVVRRLVGYRRLEGMAAADTLARLYASSRLFVNFFQPSFKLAEKKRVGARVSKRYHAPETPCARLLQSDSVPDAMKERLRAVAITLDPLRLLDEIRTVQHQLAGLAAGAVPNAVPHRDGELDQFLKSLSTAWHDGEVRPTHRKEPKPRRDWRTRKDPFEAVWPRIVGWLDSEPDRTASELLVRLQAEETADYPAALLRTLQRRVKIWRRAAAMRLVFTADIAAAAPTSVAATAS